MNLINLKKAGFTRIRIITAPYQFYHMRKGQPIPFWLFGVIDRETNDFRFLILNWNYFSYLRTLYNQFGSPENYDIDLSLEKDWIQMLPKSPLTAQDLMVKDAIDLEEISLFCKEKSEKVLTQSLNP